MKAYMANGRAGRGSLLIYSSCVLQDRFLLCSLERYNAKSTSVISPRDLKMQDVLCHGTIKVTPDLHNTAFRVPPRQPYVFIEILLSAFGPSLPLGLDAGPSASILVDVSIEHDPDDAEDYRVRELGQQTVEGGGHVGGDVMAGAREGVAARDGPCYVWAADFLEELGTIGRIGRKQRREGLVDVRLGQREGHVADDGSDKCWWL